MRNIHNEFGNLTRTGLPRVSIVEMHNKVFGSRSGRATNFDGYGQPRIDTLTPQESSCNGGTQTVTLRAELTDMGGLDCNYRFYWDTDPLFGSASYTTAGSEPASSGDGTIVTESVNVSVGDTVYAKSEVWNAFNDGFNSNSDNDYFRDPTDESLTTSKDSLATPSIISTAAPGLTDIYVEFSCDSNFGDVQYNWTEAPSKPDASVDGDQITTFNCENDLGTATAEASLVTNGYTTPANVWIKIKLNGNACFNDSAWSDWTNADGSMSDPCI